MRQKDRENERLGDSDSERERVRLRETESKREREGAGGGCNQHECTINIYFENIFKAGLHYGDYLPKLVPFEEQKNIFYIIKRP